MKILIDTNRYRDFCSGIDEVIDVFQRAQVIAMPFVTLAELRAGFACGTLTKKNERGLTLFLQAERVAVLYADADTTHHYANLFRQLRVQGTPIPTNDLWIAALTAQHNLQLCSRDKHFDHLPQLARV